MTLVSPPQSGMTFKIGPGGPAPLTFIPRRKRRAPSVQAPLARIVVFNFGSEAVQILGDLGYALVKAKHGQMFFGAGKGLNAAVEFVQRKRPCVLYFFSDDIGNACGPDRSGGGGR